MIQRINPERVRAVLVAGEWFATEWGVFFYEVTTATPDGDLLLGQCIEIQDRESGEWLTFPLSQVQGFDVAGGTETEDA